MVKKLLTLILVFIFSSAVLVKAQDTNGDKAAQYTKTITVRADKIVAKLGITDSAKYKRVLKDIVDQYRSINDIHEAHKAQLAEIKKTAGDDKAAAQAKAKAADDELDKKVTELHASYIAKLNKDLTADQVVKVKDEMTYNILSVTYKAYCDEVLTLTDVQKAQIMTWLLEARELAIDGETSEKKHAVFGKYKGRINNYLSAQGYDMKKEGEEWQKRINAAKPANQ